MIATIFWYFREKLVVSEPSDAVHRRSIKPVICYPDDTLPRPSTDWINRLRDGAKLREDVIVPPREASCFHVKAGQVFRITSIEGPQVGDLNLWNANDINERFFSGKTRALHGTHVSVGDRLWSNLPYLNPMATVLTDTLEWYGIDEFGGSVHDVIGTRCDPYTHALLNGGQYHHCCHSNLTRALADETGLSLSEAELHVHDVLNVFMCTGFTRDTGQYFMKASPVRPGDYIEFVAEIDLLGALSACPGGDCSTTHSSDVAQCYPMKVSVYDAGDPDAWTAPASNAYDRTHGR